MTLTLLQPSTTGTTGDRPAGKVTILAIEPLAVSVAEAARIMGCCRQTIWKLVETRELKKTSYGRVIVKSIRDYLERQE